VIGQSERPETIIVPVSSMGDVSDTRKQILQNTLTDELKKHFRIVPQEKYEQVLEQVFEELEYEECSEDTCIMRVQEMLQVENVFNLQIIGEGKDSQLNLKWITLDEKKNVEDYCEGCGTGDLRKMIGGLVEKLVEESEIEPVLAVSNDENGLKKQREEELRRKREDELRKQKEDEKRRLREIELNKKKEEKEELKRKEEEETKRKVMIPYYNTRKLSIFASYCSTQIVTELVDENNNTSLEITKMSYDGFSIGGRYYLDRNYFLNGDLCSGSLTEMQYTSTDNSTRHIANNLSGTTNNISFSINYSWDYNAHLFYAGGGISSNSSKLIYSDSISKLNHNIDINTVIPNMVLGYDYIVYYNANLYIINVDLNHFIPLNSIEFTTNNKKYRTQSTHIWRVSIGRSF
jgi:hypothetical protein